MAAVRRRAGSIARERLELGACVLQEVVGREFLASRAGDEFGRRVALTVLVDVRAEPVGERFDGPVANAAVEVLDFCLRNGVQLGGQDRPQRVGGEVAEASLCPVYVLQAPSASLSGRTRMDHRPLVTRDPLRGSGQGTGNWSPSEFRTARVVGRARAASAGGTRFTTRNPEATSDPGNWHLSRWDIYPSTMQPAPRSAVRFDRPRRTGRVRR